MTQKEVSTLLSSAVEGRVSLGHNVTVRGAFGAALPTVDVAYLKRRIEVLPKATLTLERLFIPHARQPSATSASGLDFVSLKPDSTLEFRDAVLMYALCAPISIAVKYAPAVLRPASFPGRQVVSQLSNFCPPLIAPWSGGGGGITGGNSSCWSQGLLMMDFAITGSILDPQGVRANMGNVLYSNTSYVCEYTVSMDCVGARGLPACTSDAVSNYSLTPYETYDLYPYVSSGSTRLLPIVLPCVLGGALLLSVVAAAVAWRWSRRLEAHPPGQGTAGVAEDQWKQFGWARCCITPGGPKPEPGRGERIPRPPSNRDYLRASTPLSLKGGTATEDEEWVATKSSWPCDAVTPGAAAAVTTAPGSPVAPAGADAGAGVAAAAPAASRGISPASSAHTPPLPAPTLHTSVTEAGNFGVIGCSGIGVSDRAGVPRLVGGDPMQLENPLLVRRQSSQCSGVPVGGSTGAPGGGGGGSFNAGGSGRGGPPVNLNMVLGVDVVASRERVLGRGTFATVLQGQLAGRPVAVKMFHRDAVGGTAEDLRELKQEIAILARCQHPNVVELIGAGSSAGGDEVFLVEELMQTNLSRACHEGSGLPLTRVLAVARDIASGLAYLHPTVIHRDLKPANVLLDRAGVAKLSDFGLSRLWASTVHTANPVAGTVQYMAPECFTGSLAVAGSADAKTPITHHSDIYGFGVLLWEMLAVERPWRGLNSIQVALAVGYQQQRLQLPEGDSPRFHPKLRKLILQCWEQDPRKRPGAAEIAKRLSLLLQQLETHGSLDGPVVRPHPTSPGVVTCAAPHPSLSASASASVSALASEEAQQALVGTAETSAETAGTEAGMGTEASAGCQRQVSSSGPRPTMPAAAAHAPPRALEGGSAGPVQPSAAAAPKEAHPSSPVHSIRA